ncbi:hypothetical protein LSG31_22490 [Fodinisporobacter ferrooxydans]|uniref:Mannose-6-phosphate isomerase n=1 Tax=Fodinisporobacter ferrooxydans TaxID=2901836 RepID=A0ABY4CN30_9BACL|nr:hypothetical protein LSG31_22490 [Alicyclobacillaceae bacterium MYW30-H2]
MQPYPIILQPVFINQPWGGFHLQSLFSFAGQEPVGEAWLLSACKDIHSMILNGMLAGKDLTDIQSMTSEWFGFEKSRSFPLVIKILDTGQNQPVFVHFNDRKQSGLTDSSQINTKFWYILEADQGASVYYGHTAQSKSEFRGMIQQAEWEQLFMRKQVHPGDFFYIPSGMVHGLGKGIVALEVQQSDAASFRLHEPNTGNQNREDIDATDYTIEFEDVLKQINYPSRLPDVQPYKWKQGNTHLTRFVSSDYFIVEKWEIHDSIQTSTERKFRFGFVIDGAGELIAANNTILLTRGKVFLLPASLGEFELRGQLSVFMVYLPR